jgi:peroxiredoxin
VAQLCQQRDQLEQLNVEVLLVSFSDDPELAKIWLETTCPSFHLLLDPQRIVYRIYGLQHSWLRFWNLKTIWRYIQLLCAGRKWRGIQGDSAQLAGDFIIDPKGILRLAYRSHDPTDRPLIADLLTTFRQLDKEYASV